MTRTAIIILLSASLLIAIPMGADDWTWPEKPENLQRLPKDWPGSRLRPVMTGFTRALGVRCAHCHVGVEGEPLSTYDFASDANPNKNTARAMLGILGMVNGELKKIEPTGPKRVNMWCHTCHRGRPRPMTMGEELEEVTTTKGFEDALEHYKSLKSDFYGKGAYRFDDRALVALGYALLKKENVEGAIEAFELGTTEYPESFNAWDSLGEAYAAAGRREDAIESYKKSLELNPKNTNAEEKIRELEKE